MIYGSDYMDNFLYENGPKAAKLPIGMVANPLIVR